MAIFSPNDESLMQSNFLIRDGKFCRFFFFFFSFLVQPEMESVGIVQKKRIRKEGQSRKGRIEQLFCI
jgi:hypothetical protein